MRKIFTYGHSRLDRVSIDNVMIKSYRQFVLESLTVDEDDEDRYSIRVGDAYIVFEAVHEPYEADFAGVVSPEKYERFMDDGPAAKLEYISAGKKTRYGMGTRLMSEGISGMKELGHSQFYLNASPAHGGMPLPDLIRFYEGFGFRVVEHQGGNAMMAMSGKTGGMPRYKDPGDAAYYTYEKDPETWT